MSDNVTFINEINPITTMLDEVTSITESDVVQRGSSVPCTFHGVVEGVGALTATIVIYGGNDPEHFVELGTIELAGSDMASDGFYNAAPWRYMKAEVTELTGTSAAVTVKMGV